MPPVPYSGPRPIWLCMTFTAVFVTLVPLGLEVRCTYGVCWTVDITSPTGMVTADAGTVTWTGSLTPAP